MSRAHNKPSYCRQKRKNRADVAYVEFNGTRTYLGEYDSAGSHSEYARLINEWESTGSRFAPAPPAESAELTVSELLARFWVHAEQYYVDADGEPTSELSNLRLALRPVRRLYGNRWVTEFGPRALKAVRQDFIDRRCSRGYINRHVNRIKLMFRWGVAEELLPPSIYEALRAVPALKRGRSGARETPGLRAVDESSVNAVRAHVSEQVWAMIQLQLLTGARSGEIIQLQKLGPRVIFGFSFAYPRSSYSRAERSKLTAPVPVLKNAHILNTRRTINGQFHFRPDPVVNRMTRFALAYTAQKYGIRIYAFCALSNHYHIVFHDPDGRHPEFRRDFHSLLTRSVNQHRSETEAKWTPDHKSPVILFDEEALLDSNAYTIANAPRHDLVDTPDEWPGVVSLVEDLAGPPQVIKKPKGFYDPNGDLPEYVMLRFEKPQELECTDVEYRAEMARRVDAKCREARRIRAARGKKSLGRHAILSASHSETAKSNPIRGTRNPRVACREKQRRIAILLWLKSWRRSHRDARVAFERGQTNVEFPLGTYLHVLKYGVNCSTVGPPCGGIG